MHRRGKGGGGKGAGRVGGRGSRPARLPRRDRGRGRCSLHEHGEEAAFSALHGHLPTAQFSPEDLAAYLEARRRNWPTDAVVERKMRDREARESSGACGASQPKLGHGRGRARGAGDGAAVPGTREIGDWVSGDRGIVARAIGVPGSAESASGAGSAALLAIGEMYADSDEADAAVEDEHAASGNATNAHVGAAAADGSLHEGVRKQCRFFARGRCRNGEACAYQHRDDGAFAFERRQPGPDPAARRKSLLHMLLVKEIRAERSALLQCFRHLLHELNEDRSLKL